MRILVITDTTDDSAYIHNLVMAERPGTQLAFLHMYMFGPMCFDYPSTVRSKEAPVLSRPTWRLRQIPIIDYAMTGQGLCPQKTMPQVPDLAGILTWLQGFDEILIAVRARPTSQMSATQALELVAGSTDLEVYPPIYQIKTFDERGAPDHRATWEARQPFLGRDDPAYRLADIKRYFDWNYNVNSQAVIGDLMRELKIWRQHTLLTKYQILILHAIASGRFTGTDRRALYGFMRDYRGTGKYPPAPIGSHLSRTGIVDCLMYQGLINPDNLALTEAGKRLADSLPPRTDDPDLPGRLNAWRERPVEQARQDINAYLGAVFSCRHEKKDLCQFDAIVF